MRFRNFILGALMLPVLSTCSKRQSVVFDSYRIVVDPALAPKASEALQNWYQCKPFHGDVDVDGREAQLRWVVYPKSPPTMVITLDHASNGGLGTRVRFGRRGDEAELRNQMYSCKERLDEVCQVLDASGIPYNVFVSDDAIPLTPSRRESKAEQGIAPNDRSTPQ